MHLALETNSTKLQQ